MRELIRSNDAVLLSFASSLLKQEGIVHFVADAYMSVLEGSLGILQRRLLVDPDRYDRAIRLFDEAGLMPEVRRDRQGSGP